MKKVKTASTSKANTNSICRKDSCSQKQQKTFGTFSRIDLHVKICNSCNKFKKSEIPKSIQEKNSQINNKKEQNWKVYLFLI